MLVYRVASRAVAIVIALQAGALACSRASDKPARTADSGRLESVAIVPPQVDADTAGCEAPPVMAHADPDSLLKEFVHRDSAGQFTQSSEWFSHAVDCPGHEPGPDAATAIRGVTLRRLDRDSMTLRAEARWERAVEPGTLIETLTVKRTPYGWRVQSPALNPKVPGR